MSYDTIIRNGRWFDGTGAPSAVRNIGIRDGHVVAIAPQALDDTDCPQVIDATGKWVLPGMLDIHTHYDVEVLDGPSLSESLRHGVTTVMLGSCSLSTVHVDGIDAGDIFGRVEAIPREHVIGAVDEHKTWTNCEEYIARARGAAARPQRGGVHRALRHARRDHGPGPRHAEDANARPRASRPRWSGCSPRRYGPGSSECPRSNCFSTSSTATSAARAHCRRRMPSRVNCAG